MKKTDVERMSTHKETKSALTSKKAFIPLAVTVLSLLLAALTEYETPTTRGGPVVGVDRMQCQRFWAARPAPTLTGVRSELWDRTP